MLSLIRYCLIIAVGWSIPSVGYALSKQDLQKARDVAKRVHQHGRYGDKVPLEQTQNPVDRRKQACEQDSGCFGCQGCVRSLTPLFQLSAGCAAVAPWIFLVIAVFLLVVWFNRYLQRADKIRPIPETIASKPTLWGAELPVELDPSQLAAEGKFDAGIGVLLWHALRAVGWKPEGVGQSQTPREILHNLSSQDDRFSPLQQLLRLAERVRFGGIQATQEMFTQAQQWHDAVLEKVSPI